MIQENNMRKILYILKAVRPENHPLYSKLFLIFILACCISACKNGQKSTADIICGDSYQSKILPAFNSHISINDTAKMERYQTFDEHTMSGKGQALHSPFVYVKRWNDSILVFSSNKNDSTRLYIKLNDEIWYSHMEYEMWKKKHFIPSKDKLSKTARTYDRYFFNDTILEVETSYITGKQYHQLYVKYKNEMYLIRNINHIDYSKIANLRKTIRDMIISNDKRVTRYTLKEEKDRYVYRAEDNSDSYAYEKNTYGLWGIQPGIEETFLYNGIDIREYSDNLEMYQQNNPDSIYEIADDVPKFSGGVRKYDEFIKSNRDNSLLRKAMPYRVTLEVVIEKDGSVTNARVVSSIDLAHDNDALRIIKKMPKWTPAKLNNKIVRYKMLVPISYKEG